MSFWALEDRLIISHGKTRHSSCVCSNYILAPVMQPVISVWVITYNHAEFIRACLDSILLQRTNYSLEVCIGEDDSTDGTREICQEYAKRYPDVIRLFLRDRCDPRRLNSVGVWQFNFIETFRACQGRYIATCDGDDYWCDPNKLQTQVDYLEAHPEFSGCFHKIARVDAKGSVICADCGYPPRRQESYSLNYLLRHSNFSPMLSTVFRNRGDIAPEWIMEAPFGDMVVHAGNLRHGNYGFIDKVMGCYRIHAGGLASGASRLQNVRSTLEVYRLLGKYYRLDDRPAFRQGIRALRLSIIVEVFLDKFLPAKFKRYVDSVIGAQFRSIVRYVLTLWRV